MFLVMLLSIENNFFLLFRNYFLVVSIHTSLYANKETCS